MEAQLVWLAIILIVFQSLDGIACAIPIQYIKNDLDRINCPEQLQKILPFIKFASVIGLIIGLFIALIGAITCAALVVYFVVALDFHRRAKDSVDKYVGATLVGTFAGVVGLVSYLPAI